MLMEIPARSQVPEDGGRSPHGGSRSLWLWAVYVVVLAYYALGVAPLAPLEGDGVAIALGAGHLGERGASTGLHLYGYPFQSGTYVLMSAVYRLIGGEPVALFSVVSAVGTLIFLLLSAVFVGGLTGFHPALCGIAMLIFFPQAAAAAYYPSSTAMAAPWGMAAMTLLLKPGNVRLGLSAVLFGIGAWCRVDLALVGLAVVPLLYRAQPRAKWTAVVLKTAAFSLIAAGISFCAMALNGADPLSIRKSIEGASVVADRVAVGVQGFFANTVLQSEISFFPLLTVVCVAVGVIFLLRRKEYKQASIFAFGSLPVLLFYAPMLVSPKHLHYAIPFLAIPCMAGVREILRARGKWRVVGWGAVLLLGLQFAIGVRGELRSKPWISDFHPTVVSLHSGEISHGPISIYSIAIGAGTYIPTLDGPYLSSGTLFSPLFWYGQKADRGRAIEVLRQCLAERSGSFQVLSTSYGSSCFVDAALYDLGFRIVSDETEEEVWQRGSQVVDHMTCDESLDTWEERISPFVCKLEPLYVCVAGGGRARRDLEKAASIHATLYRARNGAFGMSVYELNNVPMGLVE